jgi:hypothetical protein
LSRSSSSQSRTRPSAFATSRICTSLTTTFTRRTTPSSRTRFSLPRPTKCSRSSGYGWVR